MKRVVLIHHHIFKNAGTSFNFALQQHFGDQFAEFDVPDSQMVTPDILDRYILEQPQLLAISSHHACMPTPQGEGYQTLSSILLRRPLARVRSVYEFERIQDAETVGAIKAKEYNLKDYVTWMLENCPTVFSNYQTYYCSRNPETPINHIATEQDLDTAIQNLKNCLLVGTVEHYRDTLVLGKIKLKQFYPGISLEAAHLNATAPNSSSSDKLKQSLEESLGAELVLQLEALNQLDEQLYAVAEEILERELSACKVAD